MRTAPSDRCLHDVFADQARRTPDAVALVDATTTLTYAELDERTDHLAAHLRARGVGRDTLVGVLMGRRADYVVACLAALKAGGAFLALELAYPDVLLTEVLDDADPRVVVTMATHAHRVGANRERIVLDVDELPSLPFDRTARPADPNALAFVSYSSGTTGRPKGIANEHRAAWHAYQRRYAFSDQAPGDRVACNVFLIWEMLRPLLRGATVHVVADDVIADPVALVEVLRAGRITETLMTPSLAETVVARAPNLGAELRDLRVLWLNGEIVTPMLANRLLTALPNTRVLNVYSCSETHDVAAGDLRDLAQRAPTACPVGSPLDPECCYVLDPDGRPTRPDVDGELYVGGTSLARGYLGLPARTAEVFLDDPFDAKPDARMYRTGDRARLDADGVLHIIGRIGTMIKIRGYSVEPGAVEAAITAALAVRTCVVVADGEHGDDRRLVAYLARDRTRNADDDRVEWRIEPGGRGRAIREVLAERLPHYMIPSTYVEIDEVPVTPLGKRAVDRLPAPPPRAPRADPISNPIGDQRLGIQADVRAVARVWAVVLEMAATDIAPDDDFFALGGHSLAVAELGARIAETFAIDVALADLVAQPTPRGQAALLATLAAPDGTRPVTSAAAARAGASRGAARVTPQVDLRAEAVLDDDVVPRGSGDPAALDAAGTVLLTGATGFLGTHLLDSLLRLTSARVVCLLRADPSATVQQMTRRLTATMRRDHAGALRADRVSVTTGDLARPQLGMERQQFDGLAATIDAVVHAGAAVNLVYPYGALRDVNVGGTHEILRLACRAGAAPVHFVSSNGVLPPSDVRWPEDAAVDEVADDLHGGYAQSKWVAEQLVHQAANRGLPTRVYRLGTLSGHSQTGAANPRDLIAALISESLRIGVAPHIAGWEVEMTPVDYVAAAMCASAQEPIAHGRVLHLGNPDPPRATTMFAQYSDLGYRLEFVEWHEWVARWRRVAAAADGAHAPARVLRSGMPDSDDLRAVTVLDDRDTTAVLRRHGLRRPALDTDLLATYAAWFHAQGWVDRPPRMAGHVPAGRS